MTVLSNFVFILIIKSLLNSNNKTSKELVVNFRETMNAKSIFRNQLIIPEFIPLKKNYENLLI